MDSPLTWEDEAEAVINDVKALVKSIKASSTLESNKIKIYLNVVTNEDRLFCIELSSMGFRIVGNMHDDISINSDEYYDTPYSLLSQISESYTETFANALINKLNTIPENF